MAVEAHDLACFDKLCDTASGPASDPTSDPVTRPLLTSGARPLRRAARPTRLPVDPTSDAKPWRRVFSETTCGSQNCSR